MSQIIDFNSSSVDTEVEQSSMYMFLSLFFFNLGGKWSSCFFAVRRGANHNIYITRIQDAFILYLTWANQKCHTTTKKSNYCLNIHNYLVLVSFFFGIMEQAPVAQSLGTTVPTNTLYECMKMKSHQGQKWKI